jgi:hypothetical protein
MATATSPRYRVLEVLDGNRIVVSTKGLRRVVRRSTGAVLEELLSIDDAKAYADGYNGISKAVPEAIVVPYRTAKSR